MRFFRAFRPLRPLAATVAAATLASLAVGITPASSAAGASVTLTQSTGARPTGDDHTVTAVVTDASGQPAPDGTVVNFTISGPDNGITLDSPVVGFGVNRAGTGGWLVKADRTVRTFGAAELYGSPDGGTKPAVDLVSTPAGDGYWVVTSDGGVFAYGDAQFLGSLSSIKLNKPIVGMAPTATGQGYWLVASDGGLFSFGDAAFYGSAGAIVLPRPIIGILPTPSGRGYWMLGGDGAMYQFGDATSYGDTRSVKLNYPIVDAAITASGKGYWLLAGDGGIFSFGDASFRGSPGGVHKGGALTRMQGTPSGTGYWMAGADGTIWWFGDATRFGTPNEYPVPTKDGRAVLRFSSSLSGTSTVGARVDTPFSATANPVSVIWAAGPPTHLALAVSPSSALSLTGRQVSVTATVTDDNQRPVDDGTVVRFSATGTGGETPSSGEIATRGGQATFNFQSAQVGTTTVKASVADLSAQQTVEWRQPAPDMSVTLSAMPSTVTVGGEITFTATVRTGGSVAPTGAALVIDLPAGTTPGTVDPSSWSCSGPGLRITCRSGAMGSSTVSLLRFRARTTATGTPTASATVTPDNGPDEKPADNTAQQQVAVKSPPTTLTLSQPIDTAVALESQQATVETDAPNGTTITFSLDAPAGPLAPGPWPAFAATPDGEGYWLANAAGKVVARGSAPSFNDVDPLRGAVVALEPTPTGQGYWVTSSAGEVVPRGDARSFGSVPDGVLSHPVVGMAPTASGQGYWLVTSVGELYAFGDAGNFGQLGPSIGAEVVAIQATATGRGYWLAGPTGAVYAFGDARFLGSTAEIRLNRPIVDFAATPTGKGYWMVGEDGGIFAFGDASFQGSAGGRVLGAPIARIVPRPSGNGYWMMGSDGAVFGFGAPFLGPTTTAPVTNGKASTFFTSTGPGTTTLVASANRPGGLVTSNAITTEWEDDGPGRLIITPARATANVGTLQTFVVSVRGQGGTNLPDGTPVSFAVTGNAGETPTTATVGLRDGLATFAFRSSRTGQSTVKASCAEFRGTATVDWVVPAPVDPPGGNNGGNNPGGGGGNNPGGGNAGGSNPGAGDAGSGGGPTSARPSRSGYWMLGAGGTVYAFGDVAHHGAPALPAWVEAVDLEPTPSSGGYWILDSTGAVHAFGDAVAFGNADRRKLVAGEKVTSLSATPAGTGYWIFTSRGRVLPFGSAGFFGDVSDVRLNGPVLDSIPTPTGLGYFMVGSDGGIFTFGDAEFLGSMGNARLNKPVQSLVPDGDGHGYWLVASDGGIFAFEAPFKGSLGDVRLNKPIKGMVRYGDGYLMVGTDGGVFAFSDKPFAGSLGADPPPLPIVSVAAAR